MKTSNKKTSQWDHTEIILEVDFAGNPYQDVQLSAFFKKGDQQIEILGFYDGDNQWKIRFMPTEVGTWTFTTHSNLAALSEHKGTIVCKTAEAGVHGLVNVSGETQFSYSDGTPYHPVGTTCYVWNHQGEALEKKTLETLKNGPFNKIRFCVYPKRYTFNYNEPQSYPFPGAVKEKWNPAYQDDYTPRPHHDWWDYDYFNPEYFQHIDDCVLELRELGIEADLILFHPYDFGAWGFDCIPEAVNNRILAYLVARLGAFRNIWWSFANEYDLFQNKAIHEWDRYMKLVKKIDPYNHLRSIHNCRGFFDHRKPWITHCSIQSKDFDHVPQWFETYQKPLVIDECGYEGNIDRGWGNISAKEMVNRFWQGFALGAYVGHGETYLNYEQNLWWSKGGELVGESPARIAFLRKIIDEIPEKGFAPLKRKKTGSFLDTIPGCGIYPEYGLFYFGVHQPAFQWIDLPEKGTWQIDIIDTWEMTIRSAGDGFNGRFRLDLPGKEGIAIRIRQN
jgi:hypothetical protein